MLSFLIPDIKHPKWVIVSKLLEIIGSPRARKIAGRLKISDINNFLLSIKVPIVSDLFERDISKLVSEINGNSKLKNVQTDIMHHYYLILSNIVLISNISFPDSLNVKFSCI